MVVSFVWSLLLFPGLASAQPWLYNGSDIYYDGGYVGIGTSDPSAKGLEVVNTGTGAQFWANRTDGATMEFSASANAGIIGSRTAHELRFRYNLVNQLVFDGSSADFVGNPLYNVGDITHDDVPASDWTFKNQDQNKNIIFNVNNGGVDTELMRLDGSMSMVGIGTSDPDTALDVVGVISATGGDSDDWNAAYGWGDHSIQGYLKAGTSGFANGGEAGGADRTLGNTDNYGLGLLTNNITRLQIQNNGNVGIGTTSPPTENLEVNGNLKVHGNIVGDGALCLGNCS